jgi:hypothetical protein
MRNGWSLPLALLALTAIPAVAGMFRLAEVAGGAVTEENARFLARPVPLVLHIVTSVLFSVVGALQFSPKFRRQYVRWHRYAGRVLVLCGLVSGLTGLWMNQFFAPGPHDGALLYGFRVLFGVAMVACIAIGWTSIRRRDVVGHRAWMSRAYAIGQGAGTQALVHLMWMIFLPLPGEAARAWLMGGGWIINLAVVELVLRRAQVAPRRTVARA